ncbi:MAG: hypothetical protein AB7I04_00500 [Pseudomonadales bacterium]
MSDDGVVNSTTDTIERPFDTPSPQGHEVTLHLQGEDDEFRSVRCLAVDGSGQVGCLVTYAVLEELFDAGALGYRDAFLLHADIIGDAAERKWLGSEIEFGMIVLRSDDF